ncbi:WD repeat-containing protein 53-like [Heracleum sosnowskyi]|uniref:WD repeat-containing protein 53-like n=1 Tax=Heracleum sosnowskyi TaxID=360622 RepID=A0AAD8IBH2_9APIA|nr:WD repeat-containing protein 53-like [Heracleum sosnowskyi]
MDPDKIISLFDSCWFSDQSFIKNSTKSSSEEKENHPTEENSTKFLKQPSILIRSKSDQLSSVTSYNSDFCSPTSVLVAPHLQTIPSGKEVKDEAVQKKRLNLTDHIRWNFDTKLRANVIGGRRRKLRSTSKSLSDLEFEELKGFMDLGFVFSEEDKDSSLVDIIPGLHRLGQKNDEENDEHAVTRPYLSEAWEVMEEEKRIDALNNWRVPAPENEMDMKDSLKWWAHTVASAVR